MPYHEPEADDPQVLVGVGLPGGPEAASEMVAAFAEEFARMGFPRERILGLFRNRFYAGAYAAWQRLGEAEVARLVNEAVAVCGVQRLRVLDAAPLTPGGEG